MTSEQLLKCMGEIEEKYIAEAENFSPKPVWSRKRLAAVISAAACLCIAAGAVALTRPFDKCDEVIYDGGYTETSEVWVGDRTNETSASAVTVPPEKNPDDDTYEAPPAERTTPTTVYTPAEETGTAVSTSEVIFPAMETTEMTTVNCTTPKTTEDTEEDTPDIAEDDEIILPDLPLLGSLGEYLDFFEITAETENVKLGYEYVDPEFEVSIFKLTDIDFSEVYPILSRFSDAETGDFCKGLHSSKIVSVVFCLSDGNELLRITIGSDGKGLINPSAYNGSALFEADEEAYSELYDIAAAAGGTKGFADIEIAYDASVDEEG
ncbi:MAG: hypothetical protein ACI4J6_12215 [Oscillospiraceae bacterium]